MSGCFSEYVIVNAADAIVLPDDVDLEQAACGFVTPVAALGLFGVADDHGTQAIINNAGASVVSRNLLKICQKKGVQLIAVVKEEEEALQIKSLGCNYVLNQTHKDFETELKKVVSQLNPLVALDCVGGTLTGTLLRNLPRNGLLVNYGSMGGRNMDGIDAPDLRFNKKMVRGFSFYDWIRSQHEVDRKKTYQFISENIGTLFRTPIAGKVKLENFKEGYQQYKSGMSSGKILVTLSRLLK